MQLTGLHVPFAGRGSGCIRQIKAHQPGPSLIMPDGTKGYNGLRCLRVVPTGDRFTLYSGGADGMVHRWDCTGGDIGGSAGTSIQMGDPYGNRGRAAPIITGMDVDPANPGVVAVGTNACDLYEVTDATQEIFMDGHEGDLFGMAFHPVNPTVFASVSESTRWGSG